MEEEAVKVGEAEDKEGEEGEETWIVGVAEEEEEEEGQAAVLGTLVGGVGGAESMIWINLLLVIAQNEK